MESSNAETVVVEPVAEAEAPTIDIKPLIMVESGDEGGVCDADGTCY